MIVLALDTALDACAAALVEHDGVRAAKTEAMTRGQAERIAPLVREVMVAA